MNVFGERCEEIVIDRDGRVVEIRFRSGERTVFEYGEARGSHRDADEDRETAEVSR